MGRILAELRVYPVFVASRWRNVAEQLVYQNEKFLADNDAALPEDGKAGVKDAIADLKKALEGDDAADIKAKHEHLAKVSQELGASMYAQQGQQAQQGESGGTGSAGPQDSSSPAGSDEDVVDAEIVDEDKQ